MAEVLGIVDTESDGTDVKGHWRRHQLEKKNPLCNSFLCQQSVSLGRCERTSQLMLGSADKSDDHEFTGHASWNLIPLWKCGPLRDW